jgi:hypothetical protein
LISLLAFELFILSSGNFAATNYQAISMGDKCRRQLQATWMQHEITRNTLPYKVGASDHETLVGSVG